MVGAMFGDTAAGRFGDCAQIYIQFLNVKEICFIH